MNTNNPAHARIQVSATEDRPNAIGKTMSKLAKSNPFVDRGIRAVLAASMKGDKIRRYITEEMVQSGKYSAENLGLFTESISHRVLYLTTAKQYSDGDLNDFCRALFEGTTGEEEDVFARSAEWDNPLVWQGALSIQFNETHRLFIRRNYLAVDDERAMGEKSKRVTIFRDREGFETEKVNGEWVRKIDEDGLAIHILDSETVVNPMGWELSLVPNEYQSRATRVVEDLAEVEVSYS